MQTYEEFVEVHAILLASARIPTRLYPVLYERLLKEADGSPLDGGKAFVIELCEDGRQRKLRLTKSKLSKESDLFLIDHAWSFRLPDARKQLEEIPGLAERLSELMCVSDDPQNETGIASKCDAQEVINTTTPRDSDDEVLWLELDDMNIDDSQLHALDLSSKFPNLICLSLWGNRIESTDVLLDAVSGLRSLHGLWVNCNPVTFNDGLMKALEEALPSLEIFNSKLIGDFGSWALQFCCGIVSPDNPRSDEKALEETEDLDLSERDIHKLPSKAFNAMKLPKLLSLNIRGNTLDGVSSSDLLNLLKSFELLQSLEVDIPGPLGSSAIEILEALPKLSKLNGVDAATILEQGTEIIHGSLKPRFHSYSPKEPLVDRVLAAMWSYVSMYRLADEEKLDETPIWYVMDELGSALTHSDEPNMMIMPFLYLPDGTMKSAISYSLMWPIKDIVEGEECTRDYLFGVDETKQRSARLAAWFHMPSYYFKQAYEMHHKIEPAAVKTQEIQEPGTQSIFPGNGKRLTVYSDIPQVCEFLNRPEFCQTDDPNKADIVWPSWQIDEETVLQKHQYTNQYPLESCLVMKHQLAETMRKAYGNPEWLPVTYNLETQLAAVIGDYNDREAQGKDNTWIIKPWNMARTMDTSITRSLPAIIRHVETGPKICQKYIESPALFRGKKFDLRYIVLLRSLAPLELFLCDVFWVRLALNDYTTSESSLLEYETHFTVMNYRNKLNHMNTHEFVPAFEQEHGVDWMEIHERVRMMLRAVFEAAAVVHPEMHSPKSRAVYGVDVMLDTNFQPKLLEVTYCPDCTRACKYDVIKVGKGTKEVMKGSEFFNSIFGCLFLNERRHVTPL